MNKITRLLAMIVCVTACYATSFAVTKSVVFAFNTPESLQAMGITVPGSSWSNLPSEIRINDIRLVPGTTPPHSTYYNGQYTFYSRSGESFSFVGDDNVTITKVEFNGFYARQNLTASPAGFDSGNTYWSGSANKVTFTGTGGNSILTMTVTYDVTTSTLKGDVNGDNVISGADVTALYGHLLDNKAVAGNADVNGDNVISGADVTALYEILLNGSGDGVSAPTFSEPSGTTFYVAGQVVITGPAGSEIYYTTDGSTPTLSHYFNRALSPYIVTVGFTMTLKAIAVLDGKVSPVTTATYTVLPTNDNANRNSLSSKYNASKYMYRLEWPRIKETGSQTWLAKSEAEYGLAYELEWDNTLKANRFSCYYLDDKNTEQNVTRVDSYKEDEEIPYSSRSFLRNYSGSGYARGHLCPSADRLANEEQQSLTYYLSNMQPQWQEHNGGQWMYLESDVRKWAKRCDTLYVVKAATIDDITLNGTTESGYYSTTYNGTYYSDLRCKGVLPVPKYFYMALLAYNRSSDTYYAMGIWTKHYNDGVIGANGYDTFDWPVINSEKAEYITIDELERRTGIDFFCNLPDNIENSVEAALNTNWWRQGAALNR